MALPIHQPIDSQQHAPPPPRPASIAVIDVETTGFSPRHGDRIVELAIVVIHAHGPVLREFVTLLNPERDIGPTHIHGLTASDVRHAPRFADIAGLVTETLAGCTAIAGHNIAFDHRFLKAEFERLGHAFPDIPDPSQSRQRRQRASSPPFHYLRWSESQRAEPGESSEREFPSPEGGDRCNPAALILGMVDSYANRSNSYRFPQFHRRRPGGPPRSGRPRHQPARWLEMYPYGRLRRAR
jgi:hypothetical protein